MMSIQEFVTVNQDAPARPNGPSALPLMASFLNGHVEGSLLVLNSNPPTPVRSPITTRSRTRWSCATTASST